MNDFTLHNCSYCQTELMRTNFSNCNDCDRLACAHTDLNCGIECPVCDWFVCGGCLKDHSKSCWEKAEIPFKLISKYPGSEETYFVYNFYKPVPTQFEDKAIIMSNEEGNVVKVVIK